MTISLSCFTVTVTLLTLVSYFSSHLTAAYMLGMCLDLDIFVSIMLSAYFMCLVSL